MADSPASPRAASYSPRSPLSSVPSPLILSPQTWSWKSTSPALGPRKGLYAGRRGSFSLDDDPPFLSPKSRPSAPPQVVAQHTEETPRYLMLIVLKCN
jgi:hypothetical protein